MKKIIIFVTCVIFTITLVAQPPMRRDLPRNLPNQFRDFVDHQQRWSSEKPQIERKEGRVIITMTEDQFKRMKQNRINQRSRFVRFKQEPPCPKCVKHHKEYSKKKKFYNSPS